MYSASNLRKISDAGISDGAALWMYRSNDAHGTVSGANFFANGREMGMKVGDPVLVLDLNLATSTLHFVTSVVTPAKNPGGFDLYPGIAAATISPATFS